MKLLNIQKEIPDILLDIRYCTTYNFIGEIIDGYIDPVALGTKELVKQRYLVSYLSLPVRKALILLAFRLSLDFVYTLFTPILVFFGCI